MRTSGSESWYRHWLGADSTGRRRAVACMPFVMVGLAVWVAVAEWTSAAERSLIIPVAVGIAAGWFARTWLVLATAYAAAVLLGWVVEISTFLWLGSSEWEARNADHWQGDESAASKLIGQLMEYAVFGLFLLPIVALGVWLGRLYERRRHGASPRQRLAT